MTTKTKMTRRRRKKKTTIRLFNIRVGVREEGVKEKKGDGTEKDRRQTSFRDANQQHQQHRGLLFFIPS